MRGKKAKKLRKAVKEVLEKEDKIPHFNRVLRALKKLSVGVSILTLMLIMCTTAFADKISIPFECWPGDLQRRFLKAGYQLELTPYCRDKDSWAFLKNEGTMFHIVTYKPITADELNMIKDVSMASYTENVRN